MPARLSPPPTQWRGGRCPRDDAREGGGRSSSVGDGRWGAGGDSGWRRPVVGGWRGGGHSWSGEGEVGG